MDRLMSKFGVWVCEMGSCERLIVNTAWFFLLALLGKVKCGQRL